MFSPGGRETLIKPPLTPPAPSSPSKQEGQNLLKHEEKWEKMWRKKYNFRNTSDSRMEEKKEEKEVLGPGGDEKNIYHNFPIKILVTLMSSYKVYGRRTDRIYHLGWNIRFSGGGGRRGGIMYVSSGGCTRASWTIARPLRRNLRLGCRSIPGADFWFLKNQRFWEWYLRIQ